MPCCRHVGKAGRSRASTRLQVQASNLHLHLQMFIRVTVLQQDRPGSCQAKSQQATEVRQCSQCT